MTQQEYKIELTLTTDARSTEQALDRVRHALLIYGRSSPRSLNTTMTVKSSTCELITPTYRVGMGSLFRKDGALYALVSCGGCGYVVSRLRDGCWSLTSKDSAAELVDKMLNRDEFTLVYTSFTTYGTVWTGEVNLEEVAL